MIILVNGKPFETDFSFVHNNYGFDELKFNVYENEDIYSDIVEEQLITYRDKKFVIKSISDNGDYSIVECSLDTSDFEKDIIPNIGTKDEPIVLTLTQVMHYIPNDWTYEVINESGLTASWSSEKIFFKEVLKLASKSYNAHFDFNYINKKITVYFIDNVSYSGNYITEQLNIISLSSQSDSYDLCTRLYYYGKKDNNYISIADVNNGKEYVEDFTYTDRVISSVMIDTSTEDKNVLLQNAIKELSKLSTISSSYTFNISRLVDIDDYALKNLEVNQIVKYLDRKHRKEIMHRIVEYVEHPNDPLNDEITLSTMALTIEDEVSDISNTVNNSSSVIISESSKEALSVVKAYTSSGYALYDQNRFIVSNEIPIENATGVLMLDKFGFWWNDHFEEHILNEDGSIKSTTWTNIIDIRTGAKE